MAKQKVYNGNGLDRNQANGSVVLKRLFPFLRWFDHYSVTDLRSDLISGLTVALVLIPQSMAYAQLAGLPAYYGLYASFLPPIVAAMFGSSRQLATGPVAIVSLMTATALEPLATAGSENYIAYAILLALVVGLFQLALGLLRLGLIVNFLSHPVVNGFTNAAALIIATSQLSKIFGVEVEKAEHHYETVYNVIKAAVASTHLPTLLLALLAFIIMAGLKKINRRIPNVLAAVTITTLISWGTGFDKRIDIPMADIHSNEVQNLVEKFNNDLELINSNIEERVQVLEKTRTVRKNFGSSSRQVVQLQSQAQLLQISIRSTKEEISQLREKLRGIRFWKVETGGKIELYPVTEIPPDLTHGNKKWRLKVGNKPLRKEALHFMGGGAVVGDIPSGLPRLAVPNLDFSVMANLFSMAVIITLLGFMEAISIAKAMAAKTGQLLDPDQELIGQGLANIAGAFSRSYPVSGSFSRSAVNLQSGAVTGVSNAFSSMVVVITLFFFTPLLYHLPQSVLAAIIMMAVAGLLNVRGFVHAWKAQKYDGVIAVVSFVFTLVFAPHLDRGIIIGVVLSLGYFLVRSIKPDMAILSRYSDGTFRNAERWHLERCRHVAVIRFNNSLFFANVHYLEEQILELVASMPELKHIHIVSNGINELDASGEEMLAHLVSRLREAGYDVSFSGINDAVRDVMKRTHLYQQIGEDHIFGNVANAIRHIHHSGTCIGTPSHECPLLAVKPVGLPVALEQVEKLKSQAKWAVPDEIQAKANQENNPR